MLMQQVGQTCYEFLIKDTNKRSSYGFGLEAIVDILALIRVLCAILIIFLINIVAVPGLS
ncbi:hypothetical protein ACLM5H_03200 [Fredinandcohnia humi]